MKKIFKLSFLLLMVFIFSSTLRVEAFIPITLVSYEISETIISPNVDGIKDTTDIDIKYSEDVIADINILNAQGNIIKNLYHSEKVINPQSKTWNGKDNLDQVVPDGIYTIQILGTSTTNAENTISDISKTITVDTSVQKTLSSITIITPATRLNYTVGENLDISGLVVTGTYSDGSTRTEAVTSSNITGFDSTTPITGQILTITVGTQTTTYSVNINAIPNSIAPVLIHLEIKTPNTSIYNKDMTITPCDSDNSGTMAVTAYCAILQSGVQSDWNWAWAPGAFLNSLGNIAGFTTKDKDNKDVYHFWSWYLNSVEGTTGLNQYVLQPNDSISLSFIDPVDQTTTSTQIQTHTRSSGGIGISTSPTFDIQKALAYLKSTQDADGSFGSSSLYTDWVGISFGAMNVADSSKDKLLAYFNSHNTLSSLLTDNERHAMALLALEQNPYSFNGVNYIKSITDSFDGTQFGDQNLINDDIFALIPLKNSGYTSSDDIIIKDIAFLISKQKSDGSWENSVDVTSASIQALKPFDSIVGVTDSISKATLYLINQQKSDGSWGSTYSTSWTMQAMSALSASWTKGSHTPNDYFNTQQTTDGAALPSSETLQNRIWATSYAIPAILNKPWNTIMQNVSKPASQNVLPVSTPETAIPYTAKKTQTSEIKKSTKAISQSPEENTDTPEINSDTLTATALNTENTATSNNTTPFILGFLSGAAVLYLFYFLRKLLAK